MPGFMDPVTLLGYFGGFAFWGLLLVILIESGVLFPVLPGDSLLFVAGMVVAAGGKDGVESFATLWQLLIFIPIAAIIGGQIGYWIGRYVGTSMFKPDARFLKERYLTEAHEFFEKHGPITIVLARFVPIVRTYAPLVAGAAKMRYPVFLTYNIVGAVAWGAGVTLLGYFLGQIAFIRDNVDYIFLLIVFVSVLPIISEVGKRIIRSRRTPVEEPLDPAQQSAPTNR